MDTDETYRTQMTRNSIAEALRQNLQSLWAEDSEPRGLEDSAIRDQSWNDPDDEFFVWAKTSDVGQPALLDKFIYDIDNDLIYFGGPTGYNYGYHHTDLLQVIPSD
jgi:hypothetical protein